MELKEVLRNRRAVRDYSARPLSHATIQRLIDLAILAPSAFNRQPWAFAALLDPVRIDSYAERARQWLLANAAEAELTPQARAILEKEDFSMFHHAPALVVVMAEMSNAPDATNAGSIVPSSVSQASEDCCLAAQNLMLAARDEGIGTCWIGFSRPWLNLPSIKNELALPPGSQVVAPIVLGFPNVWPESHGRKPAEVRWL